MTETEMIKDPGGCAAWPGKHLQAEAETGQSALGSLGPEDESSYHPLLPLMERSRWPGFQF